MPVLSLHNTYSLPSGSASYTLGLSGAPNVASYSYRTSVGAASDRLLVGASSAVPNICGTSGLAGASTIHPFGISTLDHELTGLLTHQLPISNLAYSTYTNPLISAGGVAGSIRKHYDDLDLIVGGRYGPPRALSPNSPIQSGNWGLDGYGLDGVNPAFMHSQRPHSRLGALDLESKPIDLEMNHFL